LSAGLLAGVAPELSSYRVEVVADCVLVFGSVPLSHFGKLTELAGGRKGVLDTHLARLAGATFAMGSVADTQALRELLTKRIVDANPRMTPLDRWLRVGERGESSDAIVAKLRMVHGISNLKAHPHDPDDLRRCLLLLEVVPDLVPDFERMREVSPVWSALVDAWPSLVTSFERESRGQWRSGKFDAPKTYSLIKAAIAAGQAAARITDAASEGVD